MKKALACASMLIVASALCGCGAKTSTLYAWNGYQHQVYEFLKNPEGANEQQITALEKAWQTMRARAETPPPGFHAHLGMLYAAIGKEDQTAQSFQTEKSAFPESTTYMDFLLRKYRK